MHNNLDKYFNSDRFRDVLKTFEDILKTRNEVYLDVDDCAALCEYYASAGLVERANLAAMYGLYLHPNDLDLMLYRIDNYIVDGYYNEAQQLLNKIPDKKDTEVRMVQCEVHILRGRNRDAFALFEKIVAEDENRHGCMADIADLLAQYNMFEEAHSWINRALSEDPDCEVALAALAECFCHEGLFKDAATVMERLIDINPYDVDYWISLSQCHLTNDEDEKAVEAADFALAIDPECAIAMKLKGMAYMSLMEMQQSIKWFEEAHSRMTDCRAILENLIIIYALEGMNDKCAECCKEMLERCPEMKNHEIAQLHAKRGDSLIRVGQCEEALKEIDIAIKMADYKYAFRAYRGDALLSMGRIEEGKYELSYSWDMALDEQKEEATKTISLILIDYGMYDDALYYMNELVKWELDIISNELWIYITLCYVMKNDEDGLEFFIKRADLEDMTLDDEMRQSMEAVREGLYEAFRAAQQRVKAWGKPSSGE